MKYSVRVATGNEKIVSASRYYNDGIWVDFFDSDNLKVFSIPYGQVQYIGKVDEEANGSADGTT